MTRDILDSQPCRDCGCLGFNYDAGEHPGICNCRHDDSRHFARVDLESIIKRLQERVFAIGSRAMTNPADALAQSATLLVMEVVTAAAWYWVGFDPNDFCIQHVSPEGIVFGGTNRLIWRASRGFYADVGYCTPRFAEHARMLGPLPNPAGVVRT